MSQQILRVCLYFVLVAGWPLFLYTYAELTHLKASALTYARYAGKLKAVADSAKGSTGGTNECVIPQHKQEDNSILGQAFRESYKTRMGTLVRSSSTSMSNEAANE